MDSKRIYINKGMNADDDFELIPEGQCVNGSNMRMLTTDTGKVGRVESVGGTDLIAEQYLPLTGTNLCIGGCVITIPLEHMEFTAGIRSIMFPIRSY
jgi:hypothetical protein